MLLFQFAVPPPGTMTLTELTILVWYNRGTLSPSGSNILPNSIVSRICNLFNNACPGKLNLNRYNKYYIGI